MLETPTENKTPSASKMKHNNTETQETEKDPSLSLLEFPLDTIPVH